ncbi:MAG: ABC transporter permease [Myxococcales bacterium]|nr:ABC transporter permease [Myxococcales bacterium]
MSPPTTSPPSTAEVSPRARSRPLRSASRTGLSIALVTIGLLGVVALFASCLASDLPLVLKRDGRWYWLPNLFQPAGLASLRNADLRAEKRQGTRTTFALFPPIEQGPESTDLAQLNRGPSARHFFGTDDVGRDVLARLIHGTRVTLLVGIGAVLLYLLIGGLFGYLAARFRLWDAVISRLVEVVLAFPAMIWVIVVTGLSPTPSVWLTALAIAAIKWAAIAQIVRGEIFRLENEPFVQSARALGSGDARLLLRHLLPHLVGPLAVSATFGVANAILIEGFVSYLGFGGSSVSWGALLAHADLHSTDQWWLAAFPGVALFAAVLAFHAIGESLQRRSASA